MISAPTSACTVTRAAHPAPAPALASETGKPWPTSTFTDPSVKVLVGHGFPVSEARAGAGAGCAALVTVQALVGAEIILQVEGLVLTWLVLVADDVVRAGDHAAGAAGAQARGDDLGEQLFPTAVPALVLGWLLWCRPVNNRHFANVVRLGRDAPTGIRAQLRESHNRRRFRPRLPGSGRGPDRPEHQGRPPLPGPPQRVRRRVPRTRRTSTRPRRTRRRTGRSWWSGCCQTWGRCRRRRS